MIALLVSTLILIAVSFYALKQTKIEKDYNFKERTMKIYSTVFKDGEIIPSKYTCDGENINPPLFWEGVPKEAVSLALVVDDPDVPAQVREDRHFTHWILWNIDPQTTQIPENSEAGLVGLNDAGENKYMGPCPPPQFEPTVHRYFFTLYALDVQLNLPPNTTLSQLKEAMQGHVLESSQLMGRYNRAKK